MNAQLKFLAFGSATQDVYLSGGKEFLPVDEPVLTRRLNKQVGVRGRRVEVPMTEDFAFQLGDKFVVGELDFCTGGGAGNAATTFARAGFETFFAGKIGYSDPATTSVLRDFDQEGIDTSLVSYSHQYKTDYSVILLANGRASGGERTILTYRGCGYHLTLDDFNFAKILPQHKFDWVYVTSVAGHFEILDELFREAKEHGVKIAWNPSSLELAHPAKVRALLSDVEVISVNKEEAQQIVDGATSEELVRNLRNYVPVAIVTDGRNGAMAGDKTSIVAAGVYEPSVKRVDATGAGDAFASMFVAKYAQGVDLREAVKWASANSSSVIGVIGSKPGILTGREQLHDMKIDVRPTNY